MAKETFYNLPDEKKKLIEEVSMKEFAQYGYDKASINRIVDECKIAKGSFYQYFDDKKDLFKYIMSRIVEEKLKYMSPVLMNPMEHDFFKLVEEMYISGLRFAAMNPQMMLVGNRVFKNMHHPVYSETIGENMASAYKIFEELLKLAIARKEVRPDIDVKFIGYMISSMNVSLAEYYHENYLSGASDICDWSEDIMGTVHLFIDFMKNGLCAKEG